jgi:hypothetical protein
MNQEQHNKERVTDLADRRQVKSTLFNSNLLIHGIAVVAVAIVGWNLSQTYGLNAQVASHTVLLQSLKEGQAQIESQVSAIYQEQLNKTDPKFYTPVKLPMNISLGSTTASLNI